MDACYPWSLIVQKARDRDFGMIELALDALSKRPVLGAQSARGCGEIAGVFDVTRGGLLIKRIAIGAWAAAVVTEFSEVGTPKIAV